MSFNNNFNNNKIEKNFTNHDFFINVSYVNDYFISIIYLIKNMIVNDCNINFFQQFNIFCLNLIKNSIYFNSVKFTVKDSLLLFFKMCIKTVYTYFINDKTTISFLNHKTILCYINTFY